MQKRAFDSLKPTFMPVSGLPSPCFGLKTTYLKIVFFIDKKPIYKLICFLNQNMVGEDLGHA